MFIAGIFINLNMPVKKEGIIMYGISALLTRAARFFPDKIAIADIRGGIKYSQLEEKVNVLCNSLLKLGLRKGDRIGFVSHNCNEFIILWLAAQRIGCVTVLYNYRATREERIRDINRAKCKAVFFGIGDVLDEPLGNNTPEVKIFFTYKTAVEGAHLIEELIADENSSNPPKISILPDEVSTILFTSGSTGISKGVVRTHRIMLEYTMQLAAEHEFYKTEDFIVLSHSPLFHTVGLSMLMKSLALMGTYIGVNGVHPDEYKKLIDEYSVNHLFFVPPVNVMRLRQTDDFSQNVYPTIKHIWGTGGQLSAQHIRALADLFPEAYLKTSYGGTELCCACSICFDEKLKNLKLDRKNLKSVGYVTMFSDVKLVDDEGNEVETDEAGELIISSPLLMREYLDMPEQTQSVLRDGWYYTGDIFTKDRDGLFYLVGRKSSMIKTGGENVFPAEVESVLRECPGLKDCCVIGLQDEKWGEAIAAAIVPENKDLRIEDVIEFTNKMIAGFRKPRYYAIIDALPLTGSGKTDRNALRDTSEYQFIGIDRLMQ